MTVRLKILISRTVNTSAASFVIRSFYTKSQHTGTASETSSRRKLEVVVNIEK